MHFFPDILHRQFGRACGWILTVLVLGMPAMGQSMSESVASPIGLAEATRLISRYTTLTPAEMLAIETAHDDYTDRFGEFRSTLVTKFLERERTFEVEYESVLPSASVYDDLVADQRALFLRASELDRIFFEAVVKGVDVGQQEAVERAMRVRARHRTLSICRSRPWGDVGTAFWASKPSSQDVAACDDILENYDGSTPALARSILDAMWDMDRSIIEGLAAGKASADVLFSASRPFAEARLRLERFDLDTAKRLQATLPPQRWHQIQEDWLKGQPTEAWFGIYSEGPVDVPRCAGMVRQAIDGDEDRLEMLDDLLLEWFTADTTEVTDVIKLGQRIYHRERIDRDGSGPMSGDAVVGELRELVQSAHAERREIADRTVTRMLALLPDVADRQSVAGRLDAGESMPPGGAGSTIETPAMRSADEDPGADDPSYSMVPHLPTPATLKDVELFGVMLGAEDDVVAALGSAHRDYLKAWRKTVEPHLDRVRIHLYPTPSRPSEPSTDVIRDKWDSIESARSAIGRADDNLLEAIAIVAGDVATSAAVQAVRIQRLFDRVSSTNDDWPSQLRWRWPIEPQGPSELLIGCLDDAGIVRAVEASMIRSHGELLEMLNAVEHRRFELARQADLTAAGAGTWSEFEDRVRRERSRALQSEWADAEARAIRVHAMIEEATQETLSPLDRTRIRWAAGDRVRWTPDRPSDADLGEILKTAELGDGEAEIVEVLFLDYLEAERVIMGAVAQAIAAATEEAHPRKIYDTLANIQYERKELETRLRRQLAAIVDLSSFAGGD
jgi:hypothetical protein